MKLLICILLSFITTTIISQTASEARESMIEVEARGAIMSNRGETNKEFFGQTRTLLLGVRIGERGTLQTGVSRSRAGNEEILEFPVLYRHQITESISAYGGVQGQFLRSVDASSSSGFMELAPTIGIDVQFTPAWDAGVQFVMPVFENNAVPSLNYERSQPIRLRTGIKF